MSRREVTFSVPHLSPQESGCSAPQPVQQIQLKVIGPHLRTILTRSANVIIFYPEIWLKKGTYKLQLPYSGGKTDTLVSLEETSTELWQLLTTGQHQLHLSISDYFWTITFYHCPIHFHQTTSSQVCLLAFICTYIHICSCNFEMGLSRNEQPRNIERHQGTIKAHLQTCKWWAGCKVILCFLSTEWRWISIKFLIILLLNKLASLVATLVWNYDRPTDSLTDKGKV